MVILGLNAFHADSAAAIVRDGELIVAAEAVARHYKLERTLIKPGFPR